MIYFDNNATTLLCPQAREAFIKASQLALNSSSTHQLGRQATAIIRQTSLRLANHLGCKEQSVFYTSGATEALNTYIQSIAHSVPKGAILTAQNEHAAVLSSLDALQSQGWTIVYIKPGKQGHIDANAILTNLSEQTRLIALLAVNNETGVCTDIESIAKLAKERNIPFLVDAVAAIGKQPIKLYEGVSAMALSAHKIHGPQGLGALIVQKPANLHPLILGGGQQRGKRSGTLSIASICAFDAALCQALEEQNTHIAYMSSLRDYFEEKLMSRVQGIKINGASPRVCNVSNLYFEGTDAESLLIQLDQVGVLASHGSACQSGGLEPSHVICASWGVERARSSVRFSFSRFNTRVECDMAIEIIAQAVAFQRQCG